MYETIPTPDPIPRRRRWPRVLAYVVGGIVVVALLASQAGDDEPAVIPSGSDPAAVADPAPAASGDEPSAYGTPDRSTFSVELVTTERQTFGSAGDLVTWRSDVTLNGSELDPDVTYLVTFDVRGGDDGTETFSFEVTGDRYEVIEHMSSAPSGGQLTATVTAVREL